MNHYQKIATVIVRVLGALIGIYGTVNLLIAIIFTLEISIRNNSVTFPLAAAERVFFYNGLYFAIIGTILFSISRFIGKFVGKDLDE